MEYLDDGAINRADKNHLIVILQSLFKSISKEAIVGIFEEARDHWEAIKLLQSRYPDEKNMEEVTDMVLCLLYTDHTSTMESCIEAWSQRYASHEAEIRAMANDCHYTHQLSHQIVNAGWSLDPQPGSIPDVIQQHHQSFVDLAMNT
jgi:fructose/tagatose bisphosphate aldolase